MFKIFQLPSLKDRCDDYFASTDPRIVADRDVKFFHGSEAYLPEMFKFFVHVSDIDAVDLNQVFHIGNVGPEEKISRHAPMRSVSVGDLVVTEDGSHFMCDNVGWTKVEVA